MSSALEPQKVAHHEAGSRILQAPAGSIAAPAVQLLDIRPLASVSDGKAGTSVMKRQDVVDKASDVVRSAKGQVVSKAAGLADTAATGAQDAIGAATGKAHDALDAVAEKTRRVISPVQEKIADVRGDAPASAGTEPRAS